MKWIGVVDTMFARVNMGEIALQAGQQRLGAVGVGEFDVARPHMRA